MRSVAILIFPKFQLLDAAGPIAAFEAGARQRQPAAYRLKVIAREAGVIASSSGAALVAEELAPDEPVDTLLIAGGWGTRDLVHCDEMLTLIRVSAARARRVGSVCSGALLLAAA